MGHESTLDYVAQAAAAVMEQTGLLPHINAGTMGLPEVYISSLQGTSLPLVITHTAKSDNRRMAASLRMLY